MKDYLSYIKSFISIQCFIHFIMEWIKLPDIIGVTIFVDSKIASSNCFPDFGCIFLTYLFIKEKTCSIAFKCGE